MPAPTQDQGSRPIAIPDAFSAEFDSRTRLYQLQGDGTAAGLLVESWSQRETLNQPWELQISTLSTSVTLDLRTLLGQRVSLLTTLADGHSQHPRSGLITAASALAADGGFARYLLTVSPWLSLLALGARSAVWQERSVVQIIDSVFTTYQAHAAWAWSPCALAHLGESHQGGQRSTTVQYRETDLAFVQRILAREGLVFRFEAVEQTPLGHRLVILADTTQAASCPEDPTSVGAGGIRCLFGDARTTNAADVAPWLLTCPTNRIDSWLPRSFALAKESPSVTWLFGMLTADQLRTRMAKRLEVVFKDGTELMLRFFDPRILSELNSAFSVETHRHFFSLCERWCSLDRNGALFEVTSQFVATNDPLSTALILKESEEHALLLASEAGQVLAETLKRWPDDLQKIGPVARFNLSKDCCSEASNADFDNLADKVLLLMHVAAQARGYLKTHEWFALRAMLASGERTLLSLFEAKDATP